MAGKASLDIPAGTLNSILKQAGMKLTNNMKFAVVIEQGDDSFGAYVPDLPGCVAAGRSRKEVVRLIREAIDLHVESLLERGEQVPRPSSSVEFFHVAA